MMIWTHVLNGRMGSKNQQKITKRNIKGRLEQGKGEKRNEFGQDSKRFPGDRKQWRQFQQEIKKIDPQHPLW